MSSRNATDKSLRKRVLMLVYGYAQDDPRVRREGATVAQMGYDVTIIGAARHGGVASRERVDDMDIVLVPVLRSLSPLAVLQMLWRLLRGDIGATTEQPSTGKSSARTFLTIFFYNLWVLRLAFGKQFDIIHAHDSWPLPAAGLLASRRKIPFIYDSHENAPTMFSGGLGRWLVTKTESKYLPKAAAVITVGERLAKALRERGAQQVVLIGNWRSLAEYQIDPQKLKTERERLGLGAQSLVVSYLGLLMPERDILPLLEAVAASPEVALLIGGRGELQDKVVEHAERSPNIHWLGWVDIADVAVYTQLGDVLYYCLNPNICHQSYYSTPNKLFESFTAGKAIIARRGIGEMGEILETYKSAILLDEVTPETVQAALEQLQDPDTLRRLQQNALKGRGQYNWDIAEERLNQLYTGLIGDPESGPGAKR